MMPWEKPSVQQELTTQPDYNEIPEFLKRELPNREGSLQAKAQAAPLPWEPNFLSHS